MLRSSYLSPPLMTIHRFELAVASTRTHILGSPFTCSLKGSAVKVRRFVSAVVAFVPILYGCSDGSGPPGVGSLDQLAVQSGGTQTAFAGTALPNPIIIVPQDDQGRTVVDQTATFTVVLGGGSLSGTTGQTNSDGTITGPIWTLGKSDVPQEVRVDIGGKSITVSAKVQTAYSLEVRFIGATPSAANLAVFTSAATRIRGFIVGALPAEDVTGLDPSPCTGPGVARLTGSISGLLIFASVDSIDGPGKILGQAGPCYIRGEEGALDYRTLIGAMQFDSADLASVASSGALEALILHEMLHVVGLGSLWSHVGLIANPGAVGASYTGAGGIAGCRAIGFTNTCANSVPVEDCEGIPPERECTDGTREVHWKETTFHRELMTGYLSSGSNPLSVMTIRSLEDLNYTINTAAADPFSVTVGSVSAFGGGSSSPMLVRGWERPLEFKPRVLPRVGSRARTGQ